MANDTWITREGKSIKIKEMASSHLLSAIHWIERNRFTQSLEVYGQAKSDGLDWSDALEYYMQWPDAYESMIAEAQRRNLLFRFVSIGSTNSKNCCYLK